MADKQAKKSYPSKYNRGWTTRTGWKPSAGDMAVRRMAENIIQDKLGYMQSNEYANRLAMQGEKDISNVVRDRQEALKNIEFFSGPEGSSSSIYYAGNPTVQLAQGSDKSILAHEIGHVTSGLKTFSKSPTQGGGLYQSPTEAWQFIARNKNITDKQRKEIGKEYMSNAKYNLYSTDPAYKPMQREKYDVHDVGAFESKADLDAVRYLLKEQGITKKYGQNIDEETFKKALNNKQINKNKVFQRMRKNFSDKDIIELNNTIAKTATAPSNQA